MLFRRRNILGPRAVNELTVVNVFNGFTRDNCCSYFYESIHTLRATTCQQAKDRLSCLSFRNRIILITHRGNDAHIFSVISDAVKVKRRPRELNRLTRAIIYRLPLCETVSIIRRCSRPDNERVKRILGMNVQITEIGILR